MHVGSLTCWRFSFKPVRHYKTYYSMDDHYWPAHVTHQPTCYAEAAAADGDVLTDAANTSYIYTAADAGDRHAVTLLNTSPWRQPGVSTCSVCTDSSHTVGPSCSSTFDFIFVVIVTSSAAVRWWLVGSQPTRRLKSTLIASLYRSSSLLVRYTFLLTIAVMFSLLYTYLHNAA